MLKLKHYQEKSLEVLQSYLTQARFETAEMAYNSVQSERYKGEPFKPYQKLEGLEGVPYVCLRLPTGGGKTLLSSYTVGIAGETYLEAEYPVTLWLVPTTAIKTQTLETLKNPNHPNYQMLEKQFEGKFKVFDIADFRNIRPQDIRDRACIILSTFASLRVDNTEGRKAYDHDENLESHFSKIPSHAQGMERDESGNQIKFSFVNLLSWHKPLVIIDEAHNAKSELSLEVLKRVNASCVIEYTATPAANSNIIHSVTAAELKAEQMIKLPIILSDHISWEEAITASIQTRQKLEEVAQKDKDYIRPIILFQAENKDKETTVDVIKNYLLENENIPPSQIAIATGEQKELDDIDLFNPNCEIRYIITVQALKEGWDCSFAYVLCSVAHTKSKITIEQFLGRVLRMPYAEKRQDEMLNKAYAHVSSQSWTHAVSQLTDHLVSMGFEKQEAEAFAWTEPTFDNFDNIKQVKDFEITLSEMPDLSRLDLAEQAAITITETSNKCFYVKASSHIISRDFANKIQASVTNKQDKKEIEVRLQKFIGYKAENLSPAERGEIFTIPQLCFKFGNEYELAEKEICLDDNGWNLLDYYKPITKDEFAIEQTAKQYIIDIKGHKLEQKHLGNAEQMTLDGILTDMSELDLCRLLDRHLYSQDIKQEILLEFLRRTVRDLVARDDLNLPKLLQGKFILGKLLKQKINDYRSEAYKKGYQASIFGSGAKATISLKDFSFTFKPNEYPANLYYQGRTVFEKHYYKAIAQMNNEEVECAKAIDYHALVKFWVRNLERNPQNAFWLPTSSDKFYPDFVAQLKDGRLLVVEYKGGHLDNEDTKEKELIGKKWAELSGNLFLMAWEKDGLGRDIGRQINGVL